MSRKRGKEISLSEKLTSLIQTKPTAGDSDDDDLMTVDKIAPNEHDSDYSADELDVTKFRRINNTLLEEDDKKYSGKGVSRRDLDSSSENSFSDAEDISERTQDLSIEESDSNHEASDDSEIASEAESQSSENRDNEITSNKTEQSDNFNKQIFLKAASDIEKGKAIKNQLHIWDFLLECRMKFQRCLTASNEFPSYKHFPKFKSQGKPLFNDSVVECRKSLKHLLNSLLTLQSVLLHSNDDFSCLKNSEKKTVKDYDDEEIFSDSEKEDNAENNVNTNIKKLNKVSDFSSEIDKRHSDFLSYRNNTIQKWNDKTRIGYISNKNFSAFEQSTLKQIELVLLDKQRLIKRTQTKRSNYHILGEDDKEPPFKKPAVNSEDEPPTSLLDDKTKGLHKEIFDDDDFYHQLLSEMVKRKANDITDPVQLGRQWMQLQKIRSKMKKTVDTKASKGRKVRFVVHPKLVNFMMPINNVNYNEEARTELFNSLFGKLKNKQ